MMPRTPMVSNLQDLIGLEFKLKNFDHPLKVLDAAYKYDKYGRTIYVKFKYSNKYETIIHWARFHEVRYDCIQNYAKIHVDGTYYGQPDNLKSTKQLHNIWKHMHERCRKNKRYLNVKICKEWMSYRNFLKWVYSDDSNFKENVDIQIDKDIYQWFNETKVYSPQTCVFIPSILNKYLQAIHIRNNKLLGDRWNYYLMFNYKYIIISKTELYYDVSLIKYCRHFMFLKIINYFYNSNQINEKTYKCLIDINNREHLVFNECDIYSKVPMKTIEKLDNFITNFLDNLNLNDKRKINMLRD